MLTLLTATGARDVAWSICEKLMDRQNYAGDVRWVIVDDGVDPQPITFSRERWSLEVVRPSPFWKPGENTQARNLLAGLAVISNDERLVVIEDDDYYSMDWLSVVDVELDRAELVGEVEARYYNLPMRRAQQLKNTQHASLCSTAMRGGAIASFRSACLAGQRFIDMDLWRSHPSKHLFGGHRVVGMKGLPGRGGIGMGHDADFRGVNDSANDGTLRDWVGSGYSLYCDLPR